jgi:hypothetical protein
MQALVVDQDGAGTGIYLGDGWSSTAEAVAEVADQVQEAALEAVWGFTGRGCWPACPDHPDGRPLGPGLHERSAAWICPTDGRVIAQIGFLAR